MREFATGATRDTDEGKYDYEGFLAPQCIEAFAAYMHTHRKQADGRLRDSDNWQRGIPRDAYMKSLWRHLMDLWKLHRGLKAGGVTKTEALCAILFNVQGYLLEELRLAQMTVEVIPDPMDQYRECCLRETGQRLAAMHAEDEVGGDAYGPFEDKPTSSTARIDRLQHGSFSSNSGRWFADHGTKVSVQEQYDRMVETKQICPDCLKMASRCTCGGMDIVEEGTPI